MASLSRPSRLGASPYSIRRREMVLRALEGSSQRMTAREIATAIKAFGEGHLLGWHGQVDRVHDDLVYLHKKGFVARHGRPAEWERT